MEDDSEHLLRELLPPAWIVRPILKDYGVDLDVELVDEEAVTGKRLWIQLKTVKKVRLQTQRFYLADTFADFFINRDRDGRLFLDVNYVAFSISTKTLCYALKCPFPLLLFVADLSQREIYWLPLRDDILGTLNKRDPDWEQKRTVTLRIPFWNTLKSSQTKNYPDLRWYALEPARMYAFALLHHYYYEFNANGRLAGYEISGGWIDRDDEELLRRSLILAQWYISTALKLDILFGDEGVDFFCHEFIPGTLIPGIRRQLEIGLQAASSALLSLNRKDFSLIGISIPLSAVGHAIELFSTTIN